MNHLPILETNRLILREVMEKDLYDMFEYSQKDYIGYNAGWEPHKNLSHTKEVIKMFRKKHLFYQLGAYAIILKKTGKMIGTCELHNYVRNFKAELGYTVNPDYWNQGIATEAGSALIRYGFEELNLKRIECTCFKENLQSKRVCEKLLFRYEGLRKNGYMLFDGSIHDLECFGMTDEEYLEIKNNNLWKF